MNPLRYVRDVVIGLAVGAVMLLIYEGVPLGPLAVITKIPFIGPVVEYVTQGEVERVADEAREEALKGYVEKVQLDAAEAELALVRRQAETSRITAEGFQKKITEMQRLDRIKDEMDRIEDERYEAELAAKGRTHKYDADDLRFLLR